MNETLAWSLTTIYHPCTWQAPSSEVNELIWAVSCRLQISPYCEPTSSLSRSSSFQLLKGPPRALWWCAPNSSPPSSPRAGPPFLHSPRKVSPKKQKRRNIKIRGKKKKQSTSPSSCREISATLLSSFLGLPSGDTVSDTLVSFRMIRGEACISSHCPLSVIHDKSTVFW